MGFFGRFFANAANTDNVSDVVTDVTEAITESADSVTQASGSFQFEPMNFVENTSYMIAGMVGIFVVIGVIIIATMILNVATKKR